MDCREAITMECMGHRCLLKMIYSVNTDMDSLKYIFPETKTAYKNSMLSYLTYMLKLEFLCFYGDGRISKITFTSFCNRITMPEIFQFYIFIKATKNTEGVLFLSGVISEKSRRSLPVRVSF